MYRTDTPSPDCCGAVRQYDDDCHGGGRGSRAAEHSASGGTPVHMARFPSAQCGPLAPPFPYGDFEMMRLSVLSAAAVAFALATGGASSAMASDQTEVLAQATRTVVNLKHDPSFAQAHDMLRHARAVLIIPKLVKGGFIFGAEGGDGVLLERRGGHWSQPAFYTLGSASFGLQAGLEEAQIVLLIM